MFLKHFDIYRCIGYSLIKINKKIKWDKQK